MDDANMESAVGNAVPPVGQPYSLVCRLHAGGIGYIALCRKPGLGDKPLWQRCFKLADLIGWLPKPDDGGDWYIGVNAFKRRSRKLVDLISLRANFIDLDTYIAPAWAGQEPEHVWERLVTAMCDASIPLPQIAVFSGRGIQVYWVYRVGLPADVLPRWRAVQEYLARALSEFAPDMGALDAARVLRLPGTTNTKSGKRAYLLSLDLDGSTDFELLAASVLPLDRYALRANRKQRRDGPRRVGTSRREAAARYVETMLADIRKLIDRRWGGRIPVGNRNDTLFVYGCFLVRRVGIVALSTALVEFGSQVCDLDDAELEVIASSITRKIAADGIGYRFGPAGAARWLQVTVEEVRQFALVRLHPSDPVLQAERKVAARLQDRERKRRVRALAGARPQTAGAARERPWVTLGISRSKYYRLKQANTSVLTTHETDVSSPTDGDTPSNTSIGNV